MRVLLNTDSSGPFTLPKSLLEVLSFLAFAGTKVRILTPEELCAKKKKDEARLAAGARPRPAVPPPELNHGIPLPKPTAAGYSSTPQP
jgi:hypothetical protein